MAMDSNGNLTCDFCKDRAIYDSPTIFGPWAYTCGSCFRVYTNLMPESKLVTRLKAR